MSLGIQGSSIANQPINVSVIPTPTWLRGTVAPYQQQRISEPAPAQVGGGVQKKKQKAAKVKPQKSKKKPKKKPVKKRIVRKVPLSLCVSDSIF